MTGPSFIGRTDLEIWFTPTDSPSGQLEERFLWLYTHVQQSGLPLEQNWFNASLDELYTGTADALSRGCDVWTTLDHVQACGPSEKGKVQKAVDTISGFWEGLLIGTSSVHGAIDHLKGMVLNSPRDGRVITPKDYASVEDAAKDGYPVSVLGSWNASKTGSDQFNCFLIMPGIDVATALSKHMSDLRDWIRANQPQYQLPKPAIAP